MKVIVIGSGGFPMPGSNVGVAMDATRGATVSTLTHMVHGSGVAGEAGMTGPVLPTGSMASSSM